MRLFFALWPDEHVRDGIDAAAASLRTTHAPRGRWIAHPRWHLTLQFLGDVPASIAGDAARAADTVRAEAFDLTLDTAGSFRNRDIPWWLGCTHTPPALRHLHETLGAALRQAGVRHDDRKPLVAHVTVLRDADRVLPPTPIASVPWPVRDFVLVHSVLGGKAEYRVIGRWALTS